MMQTFLVCGVIGTTLSVIFKETSALILKLGSFWQFCIFIWSMIFVTFRKEAVILKIGNAATVAFVFSIMYLLFHNFILTKYLRRFSFKSLKQMAKIVVSSTAPIVALLYMWFPCQRKISCVFGFLFPIDYDPSREYCPYGTVILATLMTLLVIIRERDVVKGARKTAINPDYTIELTRTPLRRSSRLLSKK